MGGEEGEGEEGMTDLPKPERRLCVGGPLDGQYVEMYGGSALDVPMGWPGPIKHHRYTLVGCTSITTTEYEDEPPVVTTARRFVLCSEDMSPEEFQRYYAEVVLPSLEAAAGPNSH